MATIDVSELLSDPDFESSFEVIRSIETVGSDGRAVFTTTDFDACGVIQPASGRSLQLLPDSVRIEGAIQIWTQQTLHMNDGDHSADIIKWQHRHYIVSNIQDFSNYGEGYLQAVCTLHDLVGPKR